MDLHLSGKTALIPVSSDGIGLAIAEGLAAEGINALNNENYSDKTETPVSQASNPYKQPIYAPTVCCARWVIVPKDRINLSNTHLCEMT